MLSTASGCELKMQSRMRRLVLRPELDEIRAITALAHDGSWKHWDGALEVIKHRAASTTYRWIGWIALLPFNAQVDAISVILLNPYFTGGLPYWPLSTRS